MKKVAKDPIIENYIRLSRCSQTRSEMPVFSETLLRVAFKQIFGKFRRLEHHELNLYRKLLLYYYSEDYPQINDLLSIMNCFTEKEINAAVDESEAVLNEWQKFKSEHLYIDAQRQTFIKILEEWSRRHQRLHGAVSKQQLEDKATELSVQLGWNLDIIKRCLNKMRATILKALPQTERFPKRITTDDLEFNNIIKDILPKINPLLREQLMHKTNKATTIHTNNSDDDDDSDDNEFLANKKLRLEKIEILKNEHVEDDVDNAPNNNIKLLTATQSIAKPKPKPKPKMTQSGCKKVARTKPLVEVVNVTNLQKLSAAKSAVKNSVKVLKKQIILKKAQNDVLMRRQKSLVSKREIETKAKHEQERKLKKVQQLQTNVDEKQSLEVKQTWHHDFTKNNIDTDHELYVDVNDDYDEDDGTIEILDIFSDSDNEYNEPNKSINDEDLEFLNTSAVTDGSELQVKDEVEEEQHEEVGEEEESVETSNHNGIKIEFIKVEDYVESLPIDIIDSSTAIKHLSELQTYALINGYSEANDLLQRVNNILTKSSHIQDMTDD